ncbi:Anti-sigma regulatory factor (Ser/Thr protein kinase) [Streptomyces sp. DI166]|uniref:ATP-binding protein n=1 Tax=Streptomyces sp. DI166 TaxID=1839783 RepID=UPI0007F47F7C|nr:ATP-binding protein [Streptomyces sp. DI166]SBT93804.1 Anti-sigma regulatory factor (Ser/Thr protein kinase) [Streptomyces sp. DI166]
MTQTAPPQLTPPQPTARSRTFSQLFSATRRGARLARLLGVGQLCAWDVHPTLTERAEVVIAELAANAVLHGHVRGRCFRLTLVLDAASKLLRVEVSDARGDLYPQIVTGPAEAGALSRGGRGLVLVAAVADHWDCVPYPPSGKTVRAVLHTPGALTPGG